jgi:hypothetical protein
MGNEINNYKFNDNDDLRSIISDNSDRYVKKSFNKPPEPEIDRIAERLADILSTGDSHKYYCKIARLIDWSTLERLAINARDSGTHPGKLFTHLTKKEINRRYGKSDDEN